MTELLFPHLGDRPLRYEEVSGDVRADHHGKIPGRIFSERLWNIDARVVDQEVNTVKMTHGDFSHHYGGFLIANVTVHQHKVRGRFQFLGFADRARIGDDIVTASEKRLGYAQADAA